MIRLTALFVVAAFSIWGCEASDVVVNMDGSNGSEVDGGNSDSDSDNDSDGGSVGDTDTGWDPDSDSGVQPIIPDCDDCTNTGEELENMRCAIDLCDDVLSEEYSSPTITNASKLEKSRAALAHFGDTTNDLAPLLNGSYTVMSTGFYSSKIHNDILNDGPLWNVYGKGVDDPFAATEGYPSYDVVEWKLRLKAPVNANGFMVHYVFFSSEYEEYIGREFNDKFYIFIEAASTNNGGRTVTNFTECREPESYSDFTCSADQAAEGICVEAEKYCYIAVNTALSECCWYNGCPDGPAKTDITGTGFECGSANEDYLGDYSMGHTFGSSTGWLYTVWPVDPGEEFDIIFHLHDTADGNCDSQVIIDKFLFVEEAEHGTGPVV